MAENENDNGAAAQAPAADPNAPQVGVLAQYIKDLSFENPTPVESFKRVTEGKPSIDVNVGVGANKVTDESYEVELKITVNAKHSDTNTFMTEVVYAGLFGVKNLPEENLQPFLLIQAPTIIFPFARRVIADATRDGGYPPLLLEPIDFTALYRHTLENAQKEAQEKGTEAN